MASGDNWTKEETPKSIKLQAEATLKKLKEKRKGKKFKVVRVEGNPPTWKEIEIKD